MRFLLILSLAIGSVFAQEAANIFEKAPPDVDQALRDRVSKFYQDFVDGKFRQADAFVAEDSKDFFFEMEKTRFKACEVGTIRYSDNFTKAAVVTSCDTTYIMLGTHVPVKRPITSLWKLDNAAWYWYVIPRSEKSTMDTPIGPVKIPSEDVGKEPRPGKPMGRPGAETVMQSVARAVKVDRESIEINPTKASSEEIHLTNTMAGSVSVTAEFGVPGLSVKPAKTDVGAGEERTFVVTFDPKDPSIQCKECLAHPQSRKAGMLTLRVQPTNLAFPIEVNYITPTGAKN